MTSGELAGSNSSCFACILAAAARVSYLFHFYWMGSGFFIPSSSWGHTHLLVLGWFYADWMKHVRCLTVAAMTCRPLFTLTGMHLKTHTIKEHAYTICHRPSGPLWQKRTTRRGSGKIQNCCRQWFITLQQLHRYHGRLPQVPHNLPGVITPVFARISHANSLRTSILVLCVRKIEVISKWHLTQNCACMGKKTDNWYSY